jgi:hypothetical protein
MEVAPEVEDDVKSYMEEDNNSVGPSMTTHFQIFTFLSTNTQTASGQAHKLARCLAPDPRLPGGLPALGGFWLT